MRIGLVSTGSPHHAKGIQEMLERAGFPHEVTWVPHHPAVGWQGTDWRDFDTIISIGAFGVTGQNLAHTKDLYPHLKIVLCWIGTDILWHAQDPNAHQQLATYPNYIDLHLADAPHFIEELRLLGITATHMRFGAAGVESLKPAPLPKIPTAYIYTPDFTTRGLDKYRHAWYETIAREHPDVQFIWNPRRPKDNPGTPPNVTCVPFIDDPDDYIRLLKKCSMVIRTPHHDGVGVSFIQAKALGRWAINSQDLPHSLHATDASTVVAHIRTLKDKTKPDTAGAKHYRTTYDYRATAEDLAKALEVLE